MTTIRLGTAKRDRLIGNQFDDELHGGLGDDILYGNGGHDFFDGGAGNDRMVGGRDADTMLGGEGADTISAAGGNDWVEGGEGSDIIYAGAGADTVYGDNPSDVIRSGVSYDDLIEAGAGNDLVFGGLGNDEIQGEGGNDTIVGGKDNGRLVWTGGNDTQPGGGGGDTQPGGGGGDTQPGGGGGDTQPGGGGGDTQPGGGGETCAKTLSFRIAETHDGSKPGNPAVKVTVTETGQGTLLFHVVLEPNGTNVADLRGLFFQIDNEALASSLSASGDWVTNFKGIEDRIEALGSGVTVQGVKTGPFDFGLSFGTAGIGKDDVREASFVLSSSKGAIDLGLLDNMDFAARLTSFGAEGSSRGGSLKLVGNAGEVTSVCESHAGGGATTAGIQQSTAMQAGAAATPAPRTLTEVVIGDNLYGNDGRDTFIFGKGDGVDLIWDFEAGRDIVEVKGYRIADVDAFAFVTKVTNAGRDGANPLDAGSHQKLAIILDEGGDAIIFNDLGNRDSTAAAVKFDDGTLSVKQLLARATPSTAPVSQAPIELDEVAATIAVTSSWWGGFQGEITITARQNITDWDVLLGTKWNVQNVWGAERAGTTATQGGVLIDLDDTGWNGHLAAGQTATIGFTALTGVDAVMSSQQILDGIWIG